MFFATQTQIVRSALVLATLITLGITPVRALPVADTCSAAVALDAGTTEDHTLDVEQPERCFKVAAPQAGILLIDTTASAGTSRLTLETCPGSSDSHIASLDTTPGQRILWLDRPAELLVCTLALEPVRQQHVTLRTALVPHDKNQQIEIEPDHDVDGENQQIEIEPDHDVDGKNQQIEIEPDGFDTLCSRFASDDHADLDLCATTLLGRGDHEGRLDHASDRDVLSLDLTELATVAIAIEGAARLIAELVDDRGNRLARFGNGEGSAASSVRVLAAGLYFVRITGSPQDYQVRVQTH